MRYLKSRQSWVNLVRRESKHNDSLGILGVSIIKAAYKDLSQSKNDVDNIDSYDMSDTKPQYTLEELLAGANSEDFDGEYDWGEAVGEEVW